MSRLTVFNNVSLDGYFSGADGSLSWAHKHDDEWTAFVNGNATGGGALLFGRVTYKIMESYWPTPLAASHDPIVAERINNLPKIVVSKSLGSVTWKHTTVIREDLEASVRKLKLEGEEDITILGSGSIVSQLTSARLIDEYNIVINPVVLGEGKTLFEGLTVPVSLTLTATRVFGNGNVLVTYSRG